MTGQKIGRNSLKLGRFGNSGGGSLGNLLCNWRSRLGISVPRRAPDGNVNCRRGGSPIVGQFSQHYWLTPKLLPMGVGPLGSENPMADRGDDGGATITTTTGRPMTMGGLGRSPPWRRPPVLGAMSLDVWYRAGLADPRSASPARRGRRSRRGTAPASAEVPDYRQQLRPQEPPQLIRAPWAPLRPVARRQAVATVEVTGRGVGGAPAPDGR